MMEGEARGGGGGSDGGGGGGSDGSGGELANLLGSSDSPGGPEEARGPARRGDADADAAQARAQADADMALAEEELAAALAAACVLRGDGEEEDDEEDDGSGGDGGSARAARRGPALTPLDLDRIVEELGSGASGAADSGAGGGPNGAPRRPDSPPRRPRETTFPRLLPPRPSAPALPAALSALRFIMLHRTLSAGAGGGGAGLTLPCADAAPAAGAPTAAADAGRGAYGDGPLWAAAAAIEVLGLRRAYRRMDLAGYLAHWARYDAARRGGREAELAAEEAALRAREDAAAEEDGAAAAAVADARAARAAAAADDAAAAALVAADARAARVWELAALAVGAPAAPAPPGAPGGGGAVAFEALGAGAPLEVGQDADALARLPVCAAPLLFSQAPSRFSSAARDAERRRAVALKRPAAAPAKAGLVDASRAARAVARFLEVAPPSAYSQSVREARSEVVSQIGSVGAVGRGWGGVWDPAAARSHPRLSQGLTPAPYDLPAPACIPPV
jgi:hypothetical protein